MAGRFPAQFVEGGLLLLWGCGAARLLPGRAALHVTARNQCWGVLCVRASFAQMGSALALGRIPVHSHFVHGVPQLFPAWPIRQQDW